METFQEVAREVMKTSGMSDKLETAKKTIKVAKGVGMGKLVLSGLVMIVFPTLALGAYALLVAVPGLFGWNFVAGLTGAKGVSLLGAWGVVLFSLPLSTALAFIAGRRSAKKKK